MSETYNDIVNKEIFRIFAEIKRLNQNLSQQEVALIRSKKVAHKAEKKGNYDVVDFQKQMEQPRLESNIQNIEGKIKKLNNQYSMLKLMCLEDISQLVKAQNERMDQKLISKDVPNDSDILDFPIPRQINNGNLNEYLYTQSQKLTRKKEQDPNLQKYYNNYTSKIPKKMKSYDTKVSALKQIVSNDLVEKRRSDSKRRKRKIKRLLKKPVTKVILFTATAGTLASAIYFPIAHSKKSNPGMPNPTPTHDTLSSDDLEKSSSSMSGYDNANIVIEGVPDGYTATYSITEDRHLDVEILDSNGKKVSSQKFNYNGEDISIPVTVDDKGKIYIQPPVSEKDLEDDER